MTFDKQRELLARIDAFLEGKHTGTAINLAKRLGICRRSVFNYFERLRGMGGEIAYCKSRKTFYYWEDRRPPFFVKLQSNLGKK